MLVLPLKPAVRFDLHAALAKWLDSDHCVSFEPKNPLQFVLPKPDFASEACREDLLRLQALRNCISDCFRKHNSHKSAMEEGALEDAHEYHAILLEFEKRGFPTVDDDELTTGIQLVWKGAWAHQQQEKHANLVWDRANTVFNIAALLTSRAAQVNPTDRNECKQAVADSQAAASLLSVLRQLVQSEDYATVDLSQPLLLFWENLLMAQAQNFIYRMASLAASADTAAKHNTLSVLAQSAHLLFNEALSAAQDPRLLSEVPHQAEHEWAPYCKASSMLATAKAEYHQAVVHRLEHAWGREIARLRQCEQKLTACRDFCRTVDSDGESVVAYTKRECQAILPVVSDRLVEADKDNYRIYQDEIPAKMPEIVGKQLAKMSSDLPESMLLPKKALFLNV